MEIVVERIADADVAGCFVAAYASNALPSEAGYVGYYKIFPEPVRGYFEPATCIAKGSSAAPASSASEAADLALAEFILRRGA